MGWFELSSSCSCSRSSSTSGSSSGSSGFHEESSYKMSGVSNR